MITGSKRIAGPIPVSHFEPLSAKFPAAQRGLILVVHAAAERTAELLMVREGKIRSAARFAANSLLECSPTALDFSGPPEQRSVYLFELTAEAYGLLHLILRTAPELIIPYRLRGRRFARAALRRLPEKPSLVEHRAWRRGMPSVSLLHCAAPLEFLEKAPQLVPGQLRVYDPALAPADRTAREDSLPAPPPELPSHDHLLGRKLWSAYKRVLSENLGKRSRQIIERLEEGARTLSPAGAIPCREALALMDSAIGKGSIFRRKELRTAARELINDLYSRHALLLQKEGVAREFQEYFDRWKGG